MCDLTDIDYLNIKETCRTCLKQCDDLISFFDIYETTQFSLAEILMAFSQVQINNKEDFPNQICRDCAKQIVNSYNYKIKVQENEKFLTDYISKKKLDFLQRKSNCLSQNEEEIVLMEIKVEGYEQISVKPNEHLSHIDAEDFDNHNEVSSEQDGGDMRPPSKVDDLNHFVCCICNGFFSNDKELYDHIKEHSITKKEDFKEDDNQIENSLSQCENRNEATNFTNESHSSLERLPVSQANFKRRQKCGYRETNPGEKNEIYFNEIDNTLCMPNGPKNIQCKVCNMQFDKMLYLQTHLKNHTTTESFNTTDFNDELLNRFHFTKQTDIKSAINYIINEIKQGNINHFYSITNKEGNELYLNDSETESEADESTITKNLYNCDICKKIFDRRYKALYHQNTFHKSDELEHQCIHCLRKFISFNLLEKHLQSQCEDDDKQLKCNQCQMKFLWNENLILHKTIQHSVNNKKTRKKDQPRQKTFICKICNKSFYRQEHLDRHKSIHEPNEKKFECCICHKKFNRKDNMKSHMKIHREDREKDSDKHLCVYCGRSFSNSSNLIVHMRRHTGEKPYKCDMCDKGFPRSSDLQCHRRTHTGEKPCLCTICGKGFSRSNKLVRHMRIHTGVRPYKCTYCERAFTQSNDLTLHIRRHTGDKPYVCGVCGERFIQGTALYTHRRIKGHYEEGNQKAPYSNISVNNPNRFNFPSRVDRIGDPKANILQNPVEIKPVGRGNSRLPLIQNTSTDIIQSNILPTDMNNDSTSITMHIQNQSCPNLSSSNKHVTNFVQSVPINSNSAYIASSNSFDQLDEGELFTISGLAYNHGYH